MVTRCARNGGLLFFVEADQDQAVALVNPRHNSLLVLCVVPASRGSGVGGYALQYIKPNWVRAVESAVPWFEARGYEPVGTWKQGRTLRTRILVRTSVRQLAGRLEGRL